MAQRKNKAILIRTEEETIQNFKKSISENKVSTYGEGLKCLVTITGSEVFQESQDCEFFSEYPPDSKHFIQCSRGKSGKRVPRKREDCQACAHNRVTKILMKSRAKIEQENSELQRKVFEVQHRLSEAQHKLADLDADMVRKTKELKKIENLLNMPEQVQEKDKEIADLKSYYEDALREEKEKSAQIVKRVTEEKKTTEEFVTSPQQKKRPDLLCPKTMEYESVDDACKTCAECVTCPQYGEYFMLKRAIKNQ
jgi:DNA repair exonuclease SbcCD ATPase subunit